MKKNSTSFFSVLFTACMAFSPFVNAQTAPSFQLERGPSGMIRCGTPPPSPEWDGWFNSQVEEFKKGLETGKAMITNYTIPVVVHIIHGGQAVGTYPNLSQAQINSQITVLNQDYGGTGYAINTYPATAFKNWATSQSLPAANKDGSGRVAIANTGIQFCMAIKDPSGNPMAEPGIDRVNYSTKGWSNPNTFTTPNTFQSYVDGTIKPGTIWDPGKYLNMWVTDENSSVGLLGYATFPTGAALTGMPGGGGTSTTDGFWAYTKAFGSKNIYPAGTYDASYYLGRTCTHEIGHYLGLRHIWGDGNCVTDYCNDTPPASAANYTCPTNYPFLVGSCSGSPSNSPDGIMYMNFMDYSYDNCMYMFTIDQTARIQTAMQTGTYRKNLNASAATLCTTGMKENNLSENVSFYPNPSTGDVFMNINISNISSAEITVYNAFGETVLKKNTVPVNNESKLNMSGKPEGMYFIKVSTSEGSVTKKIVINR